jgi:hypothetical protein
MTFHEIYRHTKYHDYVYRFSPYTRTHRRRDKQTIKCVPVKTDPAMTYGYEAWTLTNRDEQHLRTAFLKLWSAYHKWSSGSALVVLLD